MNIVNFLQNCNFGSIERRRLLAFREAIAFVCDGDYGDVVDGEVTHQAGNGLAQIPSTARRWNAKSHARSIEIVRVSVAHFRLDLWAVEQAQPVE